MSSSEVSLEATEIDEVTGFAREIMASIDRNDEPEEDIRCQIMIMTRAEMDALYRRLTFFYTQGIWSTGSVER